MYKMNADLKANKSELSANKSAFGLDQSVAYAGAKFGVPLKSAARLKQSTSDLKMVLFSSDAQVLKYYQSYDSAVSASNNAVQSAYSQANSESKLAANIKTDKKEYKESQQSKLAERKKKAEALTSNNEKSSDKQGFIKDYLEI